MGDLVKLEKVFKIHGHDGVEVRALQGIDLSLAPGEFTVAMGPSGSGKSTILRLILGLECPQSGQVIVDGRNICAMKEKQKQEV